MTVNERIKELETLVSRLTSKLNDIVQNVEDKKITPHSTVAPSYSTENRDVIFVDGIWKTYAIYKDDDIETEE